MAKNKAKAKPAKDKNNPTSVRLDPPVWAKLDEIAAKEKRKRNFLIRYAMTKFLMDYERESVLRDDVLAKLA